jgi:hypothetical protein
MAQKSKFESMGLQIQAATSTLTAKEAKIWSIIRARSGVLFLKGKPGIAKSAILRTIAEKLGLEYVDLRLCDMDETDFGIPQPADMEVDGKIIRVQRYALPEWVVTTHQKPVLICFEELNRCSPAVRAAALGILNERIIHNTKLGVHTYMAATGNLGQEDGSDVDEFDSALRGRLIQMKFDLKINEWIEGYAAANVEETIVSFVKSANGASHYYKYCEDGAYASPRTWTNLSAFIKENGKAMEMIDLLREIAPLYVGPSGIEYCNYLNQLRTITLEDVLDGKISDERLSKMARADFTRLIESIKELYPVMEKLTKKQVEALKKFASYVADDNKVEWVMFIGSHEKFSAKSLKTLDFLRSDAMKKAVEIAKKNNPKETK